MSAAIQYPTIDDLRFDYSIPVRVSTKQIGDRAYYVPVTLPSPEIAASPSTHHRPRIAADYFGTLMDPHFIPEIIEKCIRCIERSGVQFEAIAFTGVSGALIAPVLAYELGKSLIVVRKPDDRSTHSAFRVEGDYAAKRYIVADDFFATGKTLANIINAIAAWSQADCVGAISAKYAGSFDSHTHVYYPSDEEGNRASVQNLGYSGVE